MGAVESRESGSVRIRHSLNKKEEEFAVKRRQNIQQSLKKLKIQCSKNKVPNIALLGSGGGERAMVGLLGSLDQLQKTGLLDCVLYLSGISGSTWCMASLYQEPDWSTKLETVKDKIVQRLSGPAVSWGDALAKLKKYYYEKDLFSLTDVWAAMLVTTIVKEIDEHTLSKQKYWHKKDPIPIYTVIDKQSKQYNDADPWFEFTPYEAGYSLTGAFVETSSFGSKFKNGRKIKNQPEIDMLYLQALCGSALADMDENLKFIWKLVKGLISHLIPGIETVLFEGMEKDPHAPPVHECQQVLMDLVEMNLSVLNGIDPSDLDESIRANLNKISGGNVQLTFQMEKLNFADKEAAKLFMKKYTLDICTCLGVWLDFWPFDVCLSICRCVVCWTWGRKYNFLHNMNDKAVPDALLRSETRDYIDAGVFLNSPYFSVLREERDIDLIISLDFSDSDPFETVKKAAESCRKKGIPFPEVYIPNGHSEKPKDFYVFKGQNTPTVIHIPLFNVVNCGGKIEAWRKEFTTFQGPYSAKMISKLMEVAGKNITNNSVKLLEQIRAASGQKDSDANMKKFNNRVKLLEKIRAAIGQKDPYANMKKFNKDL
ncbi:cytosolic phospholipase A2 gamma-like isoform X1 [Siphateles boraxobius]